MCRAAASAGEARRARRRIAAGGDEGGGAVEIDGFGVLERQAHQGLDGGFVAVLLQSSGELHGVRLGPGDEQAHQAGARKKSGPASAEQLGGQILAHA